MTWIIHSKPVAKKMISQQAKIHPELQITPGFSFCPKYLEKLCSDKQSKQCKCFTRETILKMTAKG